MHKDWAEKNTREDLASGLLGNVAVMFNEDERKALKTDFDDAIQRAYELGQTSIRTYMLDDIMLLLEQNRDVHRRYYAKQVGKKPRLSDPLMTREDFQRFPDAELAEAYKHVVIRCFRQR